MKKKTLLALAAGAGLAIGAGIYLSFRQQAEVDFQTDIPEEPDLGEERVQVVLSKPTCFEDSEAIIGNLREGRTVVISLEDAEAETARRLVDFITGAVFADGGQVKKIASATYLITPADVEFDGEDAASL